MRLVIDDGRNYLRRTKDKYDLIQLPLLGTSGPASGGVYALGENYLFTKEAIREYFQALDKNGILLFQSWSKIPPRDILRFLSTTAESLRELGIESPETHFVILRNWQTNLFLLKSGKWYKDEIALIQEFAESRSFDLIYYPGINEKDALHFTVLPRPSEYDYIQTILFGNSKRFFKEYIYDVRTSTDDCPYFSNFFKWSSLSQMKRTLRGEWIPFIEWGYLLLIITFLQAAVISFILILLPLIFLSKMRTRDIIQPSIYFGSLGFGYMFVEMAVTKILLLFIPSPIISVAVILSIFLIASGIGSLFSQILYGTLQWNRIPLIQFIIIILIFLFLLLGNKCLSICSVVSPIFVIISGITLIAPLALFMGIPFPTGIYFLQSRRPDLLPWAWGINGFTSVLGAILATIVAMEWGIIAVLLGGILFYLISYFTLSARSQ